MENERLQHGRALIAGTLGGAKPAASLAALIAATGEAFGLDRSKPAEAWPDSVALALAEVDSDLERGASHKAGESEWRGESAILAGRIATLESALASFEGKAALSLTAKPGERLDSSGLPIRSNSEWRRLALAALAERDLATQQRDASDNELAKARRDILESQRQRDRAQARANNAETRQAEALADSLLFAAESDERGAALFGLAESLGRIPLSILAEREAWPTAGELSLAALVDCGAESIVALYSKAKRLAEEAPADRLARLRSKLEGKESGNA